MQATTNSPKKRASTILKQTPDLSRESIFYTVGINIADYYAQRNNKIANRKAKGLTDDEKTDIIQSVANIRPLIDQAISDNDYTQLKKLVAQETRYINRVGEKEIPFGEKCEALIYVIARCVIYELEDLRFKNPEKYTDFVTGKETKYWLSTYTSSLCTMLNRSEMGAELVYATPSVKRQSKKFKALEASFRGSEKGFYAALQDTDFILEKDVTGNKVKLCVNLNWLFGHEINVLKAVSGDHLSDETAPYFDAGRGLSTYLSQKDSFQESKLTDYNENGVASLLTLLSAALPHVTEPTTVGKEEDAEGEVEVFTSTVETPTAVGEKGKAEETAPRPAPENAHIGFEAAKKSANLALIHIFNQKNVDNQRIMFNAQSICTQLTKQDIKDLPVWMWELYQNLYREGDTWAGLSAFVDEGIINSSQYLKDHPTWKIYHPLFWLSPHFTGGSLKTYINRYLRERPEPSENALVPKHSQHIIWLLEQGFDRNLLNHYIRKHSEKLVIEAIKYASLKQKRGFLPQNGWITYISGILKNLKPERIEAQVLVQDAMLKGKKANLQSWSVGKIQKLITKLNLSDKQFNRLTPSVLEAIAKEAVEKKVDKAQVEFWLESVYQGKTTKFN